MHKAFISYSSKELQKAMNFCNLLEKNEVPCWIAPRNIPVGSNYTKTIPTAISSCPVFIILISQNAQNSKFVLRELEYAVSSRKPVIPILLEDCSLSDEFRFLVGLEHHLPAYQLSEQAVVEAIVQRIQTIGSDSRGDVNVAAYTQTDTVLLTIERKIQFAGMLSAIKISVDDGTEYKRSVGGLISLSLPVGEHRISATCYKLKTVVKINLTKDTKLRVGFNAWNGRLEIDALSQTDMKVVEQK